MTRTAKTILATLALLAALGAGWALLAPAADPRAAARIAAARGDWARVVAHADRALTANREDREMLRLRARGLLETGKSDEGRAAYAAAGAEGLTARDFAILADTFVAAKRPVLARLALDAAARLDPKDGRVRAASTRLHATIGGRPDLAHAIEALTAATGGEALGEMALQLSALTASDAVDDPMLDRVLARDRGTLKALDSPVAVRRLFARVLLEADRPAEARARLDAILAKGPDPEASWLLSRALLREGKADAADAALADAGGFGAAHRADREPAPFAGAASCKACHSEIYASQQHGRHATTIRHGAEMSSVNLPDGPVPDPVDPSVTHDFTRDGDRVKLETKVGDRTFRAVLDYALGSGHRGVTLMGKDDAGTYREPRISEYSEHGTAWDVTSGFNPRPADPAEYLGQAVSEAGFRDCIHCHTTRYRSPHAERGPEALDRGIGCERCHGPAGNHERAVASGFAEPAVGRPRGASNPERMKICAECHASDGTFPPTDPQFVRFQSSTFPNSPCFLESKGKMDCVTCHDPHRNAETSPAYYEAKCLSCHSPSAGAHAPDDVKRVACPVNPSRDCLSCHMPKIEEVVPHTSFTDHHIRAHRGEGSR